MTLVSQRVQILLYRIQLQDDVTKKTTQRYDQASAKLRDAERNRGEAANGLRAAEGKLASLQNPNQRGEFEEVVREMKRRMECGLREENNYRAAESAAASDVRTEQAKLSELQQRLDRLEQQLQSTSDFAGQVTAKAKRYVATITLSTQREAQSSMGALPILIDGIFCHAPTSLLIERLAGIGVYIEARKVSSKYPRESGVRVGTQPRSGTFRL